MFKTRMRDEKILETVLINVIKMFTERKFFDPKNLDNTIRKLVGLHPDDLTYNIKDVNNNTISILILPQKITGVTKNSIVSEFLNIHKDNYKVLIIKDINKKAHQHILGNHANTEIFKEEELMINLIDIDLVPKYIILTPEETKSFFQKYKCTKKEMPKILVNDPAARYYNMKIGNICRIIRPSGSSGLASSYRLVVGYTK